MADEAREYTDEQLAEMEKELSRIYRRSRKELTEEWDQYMRRAAEQVSVLWLAYQNAPDPDARADALKRYQDAVQNQTLRNRWYRDMVNNTTRRLAEVNQIAADYVNGQLPDIYRVNYGQLARDFVADDYEIPTGIAWDIRSEETMARLARGEVVLPGSGTPVSSLSGVKRQINQQKDMLWNSRMLNSSILQGILKGESIKKMSERLLPIVQNNEKSAVRAARTMVTGAENAGRLDSYKDLENEGAVMNKVWIATPDGRVRDWHLSMDGQEVGINDPFVDGNGNKLMRPADTSLNAPGNTIWNCRCSMRSQILGFRRADGSIQPLKRHEHNGLHQSQIARERANRRA